MKKENDCARIDRETHPFGCGVIAHATEGLLGTRPSRDRPVLGRIGTDLWKEDEMFQHSPRPTKTLADIFNRSLHILAAEDVQSKEANE